MGPWLLLLQGSSERVVIHRYPFLAYCEKVSYNNLTCYLRVPLQFAWQGQIFPNSTQDTDMVEACPTCLGYVFSEIQATVKYYTKIFG